MPELTPAELDALDAVPDRLRLLARYIDHLNPGDQNPEVQTDLRRWADLLPRLAAAARAAEAYRFALDKIMQWTAAAAVNQSKTASVRNGWDVNHWCDLIEIRGLAADALAVDPAKVPQRTAAANRLP